MCKVSYSKDTQFSKETLCNCSCLINFRANFHSMLIACVTQKMHLAVVGVCGMYNPYNGVKYFLESYFVFFFIYLDFLQILV